jgi:putative heme iron utilization protein
MLLVSNTYILGLAATLALKKSKFILATREGLPIQCCSEATMVPRGLINNTNNNIVISTIINHTPNYNKTTKISITYVSVLVA